MFRNRFRSIITLMLIAILTVPFFSMPVHAAYENTYKNTGNQRNDIIGVALTQVGYKEGSNNYTKYGVWYGKPNSPWCGMFVSWCAKEAGIPTSVLKKSGVANPKNFGLSYKSGKSYTPQKGDLFFKKGFSHVGLVYYTEGDYFYTIEGNTYTSGVSVDCVMIRKRKISDFYFSSPDYAGSSNKSTNSGSNSKTGTSNNTKCTHTYKTKVESEHPHKEYKICTKCSKKTYTDNKKTIDSCKTCIQATCKHTFSEWKESSDSKHIRTCNKCGLKKSGTHTWKKGKILKEATCVSDGKQQMVCSDCKAESSKKIKATGTHSYSAPTYKDETTHTKTCSICKKQVTAKHTISSKWQHDSIYHWSSCSDCGSKIKQAEHNHPDGCLSACKVCSYTDENGHRLNGHKEHNDESHWEICGKCGMIANEENHIYASDCDETCNTCGYQRVVTTPHQDTLHSDDTGHWFRCSACERVTDVSSHTPDQDANEWDDQLCIHCGYVLRTDDRHTHHFEHVEYNADMHWGTCACGEEMAQEVHCWDFQTNICSICGITADETNNDQSGNFLTVLIHRLLSES